MAPSLLFFDGFTLQTPLAVFLCLFATTKVGISGNSTKNIEVEEAEGATDIL